MRTFGSVVMLLSFILFVSFLPTAEAAVPQTYTNDNLWSTTHDMPVSFAVQDDGSITGLTASGKQFSQINVATDVDIRLQKFTIDEAWFYVDGYETFFAPTDEQAIEHAVALRSVRLVTTE